MYVVVRQHAKSGFILSIVGTFSDIDDGYAYMDNLGGSNGENEYTVRFVDRP